MRLFFLTIMQFTKLRPADRKAIVSDLIDGLTLPELQDKYDIDPAELNLFADSIKLQYKDCFPVPEQDEKREHNKRMLKWIAVSVALALVAYFAIVLIQATLSSFEKQIVSDSLAYITLPLSDLVDFCLATAVIVFFMHRFFPILSIFINEKVNTVSLKDTFLEAKPESKLNFLAIIFLSLCLLVGLVFASSAATPATPQQQRNCLVGTAMQEVGTLETGGNNKGKEIDVYRSVSLRKEVKNYTDPWCGYFVDYLFKICNIKTAVPFPPRAADWFKDPEKIIYRRNFKTGIVKSTPKAGDVIGYLFQSGRISHVEILVAWKPPYFYSVGGNTSNKDLVQRDANSTDGVRYKKRKIETAYVIASFI